MAKNITVVQSCHRNLTDNHLQKGTKSRKDTKLVLVETEASRCGKVTTFHDTGSDKDLWVLLVNDFETGGTLEVTCKTC